MKLNELGVSLLETVYGVAILSLIAVTLLPLLQQFQNQLHMKQQMLHASEVALNGAKMVAQFDQVSGVAEINEVEYTWEYAWGEICVYFEGLEGKLQSCIDATE